MTRTNMDRAKEAQELCEKFEQLTGTDTLDDQVSDIMCHLMHLCRLITPEDGEPIDFDDALRLARINFEAEVEEDPDTDGDGPKVYAHSPDACPSNHWNGGDDVCEDCGKHLNEDSPEIKPDVITVIVTEQTSPFPPAYPAPRIYQLEGVAASDEDEILRQIAILRHEEIEGDDYDDEIIDQIRQGLRLQFVVAGELTVARDYRT